MKMKYKIRKALIFMLIFALFLTTGSVSVYSNAAQSSEQQGPDLNYLVVDNSYLELGEEQKVVVSIGDGANEVTDATLYYENKRTGQIYSQEADMIDGDALLFRMEFKSESEIGTYQLKNIHYMFDGKQTELSLEELEISAVFGVATEADVHADAYVLDEDTTDVVDAAEDNIVTFDADGNQTSAISIAEAIDNAMETSSVNISQYSLLGQYGASNGSFVIVLDPGHGGSDTGAIRTINGVTYQERDIVLKIAQYCKEELEIVPGIKVYLTRTDNTSALMDRKQRTDFAVSKGADVIVSLHINATSDNTTTASGAQIYCPNGNTASGRISRELADKILEKLAALGLVNRGKVVDEELGMILYPKQRGIPGILIEHAFINNLGDVSNFLSSDAQLKKLGIADAQGILEYFNFDYGEALVNKYSAVFDAEYYYEHYPDLQRAFGEDTQKLLNHFLNYGMNEGRQGNSTFNVVSYLYRYPDLRRVYGNNLKSYYLHYINYGKKEGRQATGTTSMQGYQTVYNGVDYSAVYDYNFYVENYPDVKKTCGYDDAETLEYFVSNGMSAGQQGSDAFDVNSYRLQYVDLRRVYGSNLKSYYLHYINYGKKEGRQATGNSTLNGYVTTYNGVDYSAIYDYNFYITKYTDIKNAFGDDDIKVLAHFVNSGMKEGRQGNDSFDVSSYANLYPDLRRVYGNNLKSYYLHYLNYGQKEGRQATGTDSMQRYQTVYNGVDYSAVYDYNFYITKYPDIKKAFRVDDTKVLAHFVNSGMKEGRQGNDSFDVSSYANLYPDLRRVYGNNLKSYYLHYLNYGQKEGRQATGTDSMQRYQTVYNGVDYSAVYDYNFYITKYPDIKKAFRVDDTKVLAHFVNSGMKEGRQGNEEFNVSVYRNRYDDLQKAFGSNLQKYYMHYLNNGIKEGRSGKEDVQN